MKQASTRGQGDHDPGLRLRMRGEEQRIASQHERLDVLCRELYTKIDKDGAAKALPEFTLFMTALDAHMTVEEDIYFPALHGLCADAGSELSELAAEHVELRGDGDEIRAHLRANDRDSARLALDRFARRVSAHEHLEEDLITRITEGPLNALGHSSLER